MKKFTFFIVISTLMLANASVVFAGFGISPPYVKSTKLTPGTHYEQKITLLRSSANDDLLANIIVDAPDISSWITFDKGLEFDLPKNELQVPMIVKVDVPGDAELDNYRGHINIRISPKEKRKGGGVAIALGARIDIDLSVTNEVVPDFNIKKVDVLDIEELKFPFNLPVFKWFFYRVRVALKIENIGNVPTAPSKVSAEIFDLSKKKKLAEYEDRGIEKIEPFSINDVQATFPTRLSVGQYWIKVKVYKENNIVFVDEKVFNVAHAGELKNGAPPLGVWPWVMLAAVILTLLAIILALIKVKSWRYLFRALYIVVGLPIIALLRKIKGLLSSLNVKFWKWMHKKSAKYQDYDVKKKNRE